MGYVQISDSNQTEILFNVSQAQAENLLKRGMIETCPGMAPYCIKQPLQREDLDAYFREAYHVRRNGATGKYWNHTHNEEREALDGATVFAKPRENTGRTEWVFVKNGRVAE
jgi:hypothetical protein